jgi:hypothetical protein
VILYVDPSCPFAWITSRWLGEVARRRVVDVELRLLSLSVVNEHREISTWYRGFNDAAWAPARVMLAVGQGLGHQAAQRFYDAFGERFHVGLDTADGADRVELAAAALADAHLPPGLIAAAHDVGLDDALRSLTRAALEPVGLDVGVPVLVLEGVAASGPVLSEVPRGEAATDLFDAVRVLVHQRGFMRFERQRVGALHAA